MVKSGAIAVNNKAGLFGSYTAGFLNDFFGVGAIFWPFVFAFLGAAYISSKFNMHWWRWCGFFILTLSILTFAAACDFALGDLSGGGMIGKTLYLGSNHYFSPAGSLLLWIFITLIGLQLSGNFSWFNLASKAWAKLLNLFRDFQSGRLNRENCQNFWKSIFPVLKEKAQIFLTWPAKQLENLRIKINKIPDPLPLPQELPTPIEVLPPKQEPVEQKETQAEENIRIIQSEEHHEVDNVKPLLEIQTEFTEEEPAEEQFKWEEEPEIQKNDSEPEKWFTPVIETVPETELVLPSLDLLNPPGETHVANVADRERKGQALMKCFEDFDIRGKLARITPGPVVTMYEVRPDPGIRVSKISNLNDDLSLALKAVSVRIQAPIPGSDTVGIEIPNDEREMVNFRELAETDQFQNATGPLTMILGKDIAGRPYMADLSKMPHLLVAGATGAGKSVCLNSILISMLYRLRPKDLRLLLVDPKRIEMAVYADLPHLIHPVVTEMEDAKNALEWALQEMDNRYKALGRLGARNMASYNQKLAAMGKNRLPEHEDLQHLPYLVIVIDELADLMMTAAREAQTSILRLAQLARAAGIHMILATQRPSVDVVTGLIKANFLNRISFQVTSKHDSRTILDQTGAEYLLGKGDMLYKPSSGRLLRLHGPYLSDEEVAAVTTHWKKQQTPKYEIDFSQWGEEETANEPEPSAGCDDPLYSKVREFVLEQGKASISMLQRHFSVGFGRSGRLIAQLEREGIIGKADGSKPRNVLR